MRGEGKGRRGGEKREGKRGMWEEEGDGREGVEWWWEG